MATSGRRGVIVFQLDGDAVKTLPNLLEAATSAATEQGLLYDPPGAMYLAAGCEDLRASAFQDAVAVGKEDATLLADALGVELGGLTRAVKLGVNYGPAAYGFNQSDSCDDLVDLGRLAHLPARIRLVCTKRVRRLRDSRMTFATRSTFRSAPTDPGLVR